VLDRYAGHDEDIIARLRHLLYRAREIRSLIHKAGSTIAPPAKQPAPAAASRLAGTRILVVDADESIRRSAHHLLGSQGASVETARDAHEAIALMRQAPYSSALVDIRLPDLDGYETYKRLREVQPNVPIILMTGFGWDPSHSIVKARQEGLQTVLYKPFRADRLMEAVEQALRTSTACGSGSGGAPQDHHANRAPTAPDVHASGGRAAPAASPPASPGDSRPIEASRHES
jgi:DNA-binding NtrC family response regulator